MTFSDRMSAAAVHEEAVLERLRSSPAYAWAEPFGQGLLTERMRDLLRRIPRQPFRWTPDIIAVRIVTDKITDPLELWDAKTGRTDTPNYDIEKAAIDSHQRWAYMCRATFRYCMADFAVVDLDDITTAINDGHIQPGPRSPNGSGTPYYLIPKGISRYRTLPDRKDTE